MTHQIAVIATASSIAGSEIAEEKRMSTIFPSPVHLPGVYRAMTSCEKRPPDIAK